MAEPLPDRVLIVRLGAIGDVANALVVATALKSARPGLNLGWAVHDLAAPLVHGHPDVDQAHVWRRRRGPDELASFLGGVRAEGYGLALDLQRTLKSALIARLSRAPRVVGFDRKRAKELSWLWTKERLAPREPARHMVQHYLEFAQHLGAPASVPRHLFPPDSAADEWASERVRELGGEPVLVNLGATKPANRWMPERFGALARQIVRELGVPACFTGGPGDRVAADVARAAAGDAPVRDLVGATSLRQLVALSRRARLHVGCDTGPMHVAAAVGTPCVALFGPADPARTGPWGPGHRIVRVPPPCAPCNRKTCNQPRHACMEDITVEHVLAAARETLGLVRA